MNDSEIQLVINKQIQAPVAKVYQAWIDPQMIKQWFGPDPSMRVPRAEVDLKVGGEYLFHMNNPAADSDHIVGGSYEEIIPNEKLVFNWKWQNGVDRTHVTIEFQPKGDDETMLTLTHRGFSQQEFADKHRQGWTGCLVNLNNYFT